MSQAPVAHVAHVASQPMYPNPPMSQAPVAHVAQSASQPMYWNIGWDADHGLFSTTHGLSANEFRVSWNGRTKADVRYTSSKESSANEYPVKKRLRSERDFPHVAQTLKPWYPT